MMSSAAQAAQAGRGVRLGADTLSRLLDDLCKPGALERRREGERHLLEYVEAEARDLSADAFSKFMQEVYARLQAMIKRCEGGGRRASCAQRWANGVPWLPSMVRESDADAVVPDMALWPAGRAMTSAPPLSRLRRAAMELALRRGPRGPAGAARAGRCPPRPRCHSPQPRRVQAPGGCAGDRGAYCDEGHWG
jgi:hypothetical protein